MPRKVLIFDTSVLCCLLRVAGKETAGPDDDRWDHDRISRLIAEEKATSTFVLPLASIIETGNHIAQSKGDKYVTASRLGRIIADAAAAATPWAAFTEQAVLWEESQLARLAQDWPDLAKGGLSIGDATIKDVAEYYARTGCTVEIVTGDAGLRAYDSASPPPTPRRRSTPQL